MSSSNASRAPKRDHSLSGPEALPSAALSFEARTAYGFPIAKSISSRREARELEPWLAATFPGSRVVARYPNFDRTIWKHTEEAQ